MQSASEAASKSTVLVVGAGGIGCELLKNLVYTGFRRISIVDLDTIDVSNLNRQFLFRKEHVRESKAKVARDSVLKYNKPDLEVTAYHDSIIDDKFDVDYFQQFDLVLIALDNRTARNHVNRMCLAANVPFVESGTAGYLGQVTVVKKGETACYECKEQEHQKSYPACTIRNTPTEPIHCIVWAKYLFNQLFGEEDPDEDVAPDTEDPELNAQNGSDVPPSNGDATTGIVNKKSTRQWAESNNYDAELLLKKLFTDDINYLLSMAVLWQKPGRRAPIPLTDDERTVSSSGDFNEGGKSGELRDQRMWSLSENIAAFKLAVLSLVHRKSKVTDYLVWDKDDADSLDFVVSASNLRAHIFGIATNTKFTVKSMAGNIIPAIATTNAVIAGLIVLEAIKLLQDRFIDCKSVYLGNKLNPRGQIIIPCSLGTPNPKCYVCAPKPAVAVRCDPHKLTVRTLQDKILKSALAMAAPDVEINGRGLILISSEEGETDCNMDKTLDSFHIVNHTKLHCDDFLQKYNLDVVILAVGEGDKLPEGSEFEICGDLATVLASADKEEEPIVAVNGDNDSARKRKLDDNDAVIDLDLDDLEAPSMKKARMSTVEVLPEDEDDDIICCDD